MTKRIALMLGSFAVACLCLLRASPALGLDPEVRDDAKFFSDEARTKADEQIKQIKKEHGKDLMIETFPAIPDDLKSKWESAKDNPEQRKAFFNDWLDNRAKALGVDGVYVLIVKDPGHLEVKAGKNTRQKAFTAANQEKLSEILLDAFKAKNYDEGLQKAVDYFGTTVKENLGGVKAQSSADIFHGVPAGSTGSTAPPRTGTPTQSPSTPAGSSPPGVLHNRSGFNGSTIMWIILVIIAAIVVVRILSSLGGRRNYGPGPGGYGPNQGPNYGGGYGGGYGPGPGYGGGGGGFFRNFLGGMFGGAAGSYFYDRMAHRNDPYNPGPTSGGGTFPTSQDPGGSSGGDFGSSSSGGDFGSSSSSGSDFSGGDSSGGDFGSSGGDSGSSGGDFGGGGGGGDSGGGSSGGDF